MLPQDRLSVFALPSAVQLPLAATPNTRPSPMQQRPEMMPGPDGGDQDKHHASGVPAVLARPDTEAGQGGGHVRAPDGSATLTSAWRDHRIAPKRRPGRYGCILGQGLAGSSGRWPLNPPGRCRANRSRPAPPSPTAGRRTAPRWRSTKSAHPALTPSALLPTALPEAATQPSGDQKGHLTRHGADRIRIPDSCMP
jgi:hypothetical protein